jgi:hypothetical protein
MNDNIIRSLAYLSRSQLLKLHDLIKPTLFTRSVHTPVNQVHKAF